MNRMPRPPAFSSLPPRLIWQELTSMNIVPRLKLEAPGQAIAECWVKAVDVGRDRLRLTLVPPGPERDDPTLYGRRTSPLDEEEEDEAPARWTD